MLFNFKNKNARTQSMNKAITTLGLALSLGVGIAAPASAQQTEPVPVALTNALKSGDAELLKSFPAEGGLSGFIVRISGKMSVVYATKDGHLLVGSSLVSPAGESLTLKHMEQHAPKPDFTKMWSELTKSTAIVEGNPNAKNILYIFLDPNCGYCHLTWLATRPYVEAGATVKWIPVSFLVREGPNASDKKNAFMLNAKNPAEALTKLKKNWKKPLTETMPNPTPAQQEIFRKNGDLMGKFGFNGTPAMVWKDTNGKIQTSAGMPRLPELAKMLGMKELPQTAPELSQFK